MEIALLDLSREATMKQRFALAVLFVLVLGLCVPPVFAQATGTVKGVCRDSEGKPITEGTVEWLSQDTGRKYTLKVNKKGEYFSLGISPGKYKVTLFAPDGKELFHYGGVQVGLDEVTQDFDLKKEAAAQASGQGLSPEQVKAMQEQQAKAQKEQTTVKTLNEKLSAAKTAADAQDYDTAVSTMKEATEMDPTRDLLFFKLADYYRLSATKQTDPAEKKNRYELAANNYQKAIDLKTAHPDPKDTEATQSWRPTTTTWPRLCQVRQDRRRHRDLYEGGGDGPDTSCAVQLQRRGGADQRRQGR